MIFSELYQIPVVGYQSSYETIQNLVIEHHPKWLLSARTSATIDSSGDDWSISYRMYRIVLQRIYSLRLTNQFIKTNRMRKQHQQQLPKYKSPMDVFNPVVSFPTQYGELSTKTTTTKTTTTTTTTRTSTSDESDDNVDGGADDDSNDKGVQRQRIQKYNEQHGSINRIHMIGSIIPPCIPCLSTAAAIRTPTNSNNNNTTSSTMTTTTTPIIMVVPPSSATPEWVQSMIRGLQLARRSMQQYDDCSWDVSSCRNSFKDFQVVWLVKNDNQGNKHHYFPPVVPSFVRRESYTNIIDATIRHPNTPVAFLSCETHYSLVVRRMGIHVVCTSTSARLPPPPPQKSVYQTDDPSRVRVTTSTLFFKVPTINGNRTDPTEVASLLLYLLRQNDEMSTVDQSTDQVRPITKIDGLERLVGIVKTAARTQRSHGRPWRNVLEMQHTITSAINEVLEKFETDSYNPTKDGNSVGERNTAAFDEQQPYDALTVFVAWSVLLVAVLYTLLIDTAVMVRWKPRRAYRHKDKDGTSGGIVTTRLHDLDDAWYSLVRWYRQQPSLVVTDSFSTNTDEDGHGPHQHPKHNINQTNQDSHHRQSHHHQVQGNVRRQRKTKSANGQ
jgi:hypothetical protein